MAVSRCHVPSEYSLNRAATASRPLVSTPRENQSMLGEFQSMDFTSSALCAFCAATNFAKMARAAASSVAADAWPPDATDKRTRRRTALTGGQCIERAACRSTTAIVELMQLVTFNLASFQGLLRRARSRIIVAAIR